MKIKKVASSSSQELYYVKGYNRKNFRCFEALRDHINEHVRKADSTTVITKYFTDDKKFKVNLSDDLTDEVSDFGNSIIMVYIDNGKTNHREIIKYH